MSKPMGLSRTQHWMLLCILFLACPNWWSFLGLVASIYILDALVPSNLLGLRESWADDLARYRAARDARHRTSAGTR